MAVPLTDLRLAVQGAGAAVRRQHAGILAQPHGAALAADAHLIRHQVNNGMGGLGRHFGGVCVGPAQHMAGKFNDGDLHAQTDAEVGQIVFPGVSGGGDHPLDAPVAEAAGHQHAAAAVQLLGHILRRNGLRIDPPDVHHRAAGGTGMEQGFLHAEIGVVQLDIFAHQRDGDFLFGVFDILHHGRPMGHVRRRAIQPQLAAHDLVQSLLLQQQRHFVQGTGGGILDHALLRHVAEQGDLAAHILRNGHIGAAYQNIRLDAQGQQLLDGVLGGLAFQLAAAGDLDDQGHMDVHHVLPALFHRHLTDGLQKRLAFDIAHGAADLADQHVHILLLHGIDMAFDLIGDVGDDLDGTTQKRALPLPVQQIPIDPSRGDRAAARQALIHKPLVVTQIQIGLGTVVGNEYLAVLIGAHGAGVHIEIGVEFLVAHPQSPLLEKTAQRRRADALPQAGHHAAGDKYILHNRFPAPFHAPAPPAAEPNAHKNMVHCNRMVFCRQAAIIPKYSPKKCPFSCPALKLKNLESSP